MKSLTLVPIGGLANRFYAITSAIAFCKDYNIKLRVIWFKDWGMGADFHSLFELSEDVDKDNVKIIDAKWYHYIYDRPRKRNLWLPLLWQQVIFDQILLEKDAHDKKLTKRLLESKRPYLVAFNLFYSPQKFFHYLRPQDIINNKISEVLSAFGGDVIGIHIRRTDNINAIQQSPIYLFTNVMDREIALNPNVSFYVASDSLKEKEFLKERYGERIITFEHEVRRDNSEGIKNAMIELYLLSKTIRIYGSASSTYSLLAADISGIKLNILSI